MRVFIFNELLDDDLTCTTTPTKKQLYCIDNSDFIICEKKSLLEALPQEILIRILCGVDHDDLTRLFHVSKLIREATLIVKEWHFAYVTPIRALPFRNSFDLEDSTEFDKMEAPNAPKPVRVSRSQLSKKKLGDISVALFTSPDEKGWRRKDKLFVEWK